MLYSSYDKAGNKDGAQGALEKWGEVLPGRHHLECTAVRRPATKPRIAARSCHLFRLLESRAT